MSRKLRSLSRLLKAAGGQPGTCTKLANKLPYRLAADGFSCGYADAAGETNAPTPAPSSPLWDYFQEHTEGHGIWKWHHYFDIYHRHFAKFIGQEVNLLEIGIFSGGSLGMWRSYFGNKSHIYGMDIEAACKCYENDHTTIVIGDQEDRTFWKGFRRDVEKVDILIDDGGHTPDQQKVTLEEMLPHLQPGGVYLCEDVHGEYNDFTAFATSLVDELNKGNQDGLTPFQRAIHSIHFYPYIVVIEKHAAPPEGYQATKRGTQWQPFLET